MACANSLVGVAARSGSGHPGGVSGFLVRHATMGEAAPAKVFTLAQCKEHNTFEDCWLVMFNKVGETCARALRGRRADDAGG